MLLLQAEATVLYIFASKEPTEHCVRDPLCGKLFICNKDMDILGPLKGQNIHRKSVQLIGFHRGIGVPVTSNAQVLKFTVADVVRQRMVCAMAMTWFSAE